MDPFPWDERERIPPRGFALVGMTGFYISAWVVTAQWSLRLGRVKDPPLQSFLTLQSKKDLPGGGQVFWSYVS